MALPNVVVWQSGGPTVVINESLAGVKAGLHPFVCDKIGRIYGSRNGIEGLGGELGERGLPDITDMDMDRYRETPGAALGMTRFELVKMDRTTGLYVVDEGYIDKIVRTLEDKRIKFLFSIGGGDSSETMDLVKKGADKRGYEIVTMHVPKTIDNDLRMTDHCPGHPSAAEFVVRYVVGTHYDDRSTKENTLGLRVAMGRDTGWLAAAAAWGRKRGCCPLIFTPERPMEIGGFVSKVSDAYAECGTSLQVVVSEGMKNASGVRWVKMYDQTGSQTALDATNRMVYSSAPLANHLAKDLGVELERRVGRKVRVVPDTLGYGQRTFLGCRSPVDVEEAFAVGRKAAEFALGDGLSHKMVGIARLAGSGYKADFVPVDLGMVVVEPGKKHVRYIPDQFFDENGQPNDEFVEWLDPLLGRIPDTYAMD